MSFLEKLLIVISILVVAVLVTLGLLPLVTALGLCAVASIGWKFRDKSVSHWVRVGLFFLLVPLVFGVATYRPEGFSYPLLFELSRSGDDPQYRLFINFSKALVGFILLYLLWQKLREGEFVAKATYQFVVTLVAPVLIIGFAIPVLGLGLQPKAIEQMVLFAGANLLIVCVAEEAFMRLLLQQQLRNAIASVSANRWIQELIPLIAVTFIFVAIHAGISGAAVWVYTLAGFLYGLSYTLSKNIFYPITIHFFVNQIHFSFLTYPVA